MTTSYIQLLGGFRVTPDDADLPNLTRPRQQAFLAYPLLHCRRPQARQTIAATFWPESGDAQASKNLRVLLVEMRTAWPHLDRYVQIERTILHWLPNPAVTVDLFAFEEALQTAAVHHPQMPE